MAPIWDPKTSLRVRRGRALAAAALALSLVGCASEPLAEQLAEAEPKGYVSGDGTITEVPLVERGSPVDFAGETVGGTFSSADTAGRVTVVNFWFAACAPCRTEAPILAEVHAELPEVVFVGVNVRDSAENAASFERDYGIAYPSILDRDSGAAQLAFAGEVAPNAVPSTLILDEEGRVAARVLGAVESASVLRALILAASSSAIPEGGVASAAIPAVEYPENADGQTSGSTVDIASSPELAHQVL